MREAGADAANRGKVRFKVKLSREVSRLHSGSARVQRRRQETDELLWHEGRAQAGEHPGFVGLRDRFPRGCSEHQEDGCVGSCASSQLCDPSGNIDARVRDDERRMRQYIVPCDCEISTSERGKDLFSQPVCPDVDGYDIVRHRQLARRVLGRAKSGRKRLGRRSVASEVRQSEPTVVAVVYLSPPPGIQSDTLLRDGRWGPTTRYRLPASTGLAPGGLSNRVGPSWP